MADLEVEEVRARVVSLGNEGGLSDERELEEALKSPSASVRRAAASALGKLVDRSPSVAELLAVPLISAIEKEDHPQVLQYLLKTLRKCSLRLNVLQIEVLRDIARNPNLPPYVREAANVAIADTQSIAERREARLKHWCSRCHRIITEDESRRSLDKYLKPYCHHCFEEKMHEDALFDANVEQAKRLRTTDEVVVQSKGEKRIGDWLAARGIAYRYDERMMVADGVRVRPDFYLPEYDLYIEYWGMNTPEYMECRRHKMIIYQRERKKLISISYRDNDRIEAVLEEKLSHHIRNIG